MKRVTMIPVVLLTFGADAGQITCSVVKTCA